ncbi:MAG: hypothetical protein LBI10_01570 [Deltaproteobacteria bacterium]|jgi:hypothetical protein|nr:hypothetical protein [Deltaproteobacteria bacterium]
MKFKYTFCVNFLNKYIIIISILSFILLFCLYIIFLQGIKPPIPVPVISNEGNNLDLSYITIDDQHTYYSSVFSNGKFNGTFTSPWYLANKPFSIKIGGWYGQNYVENLSNDLQIFIETSEGKIFHVLATGVSRLYYNTINFSFTENSLKFRILTKGDSTNALGYISFSAPFYNYNRELFSNFLSKFFNILLLISLFVCFFLFIKLKINYIKYFIVFLCISCYFIVELTPLGIVPYTPRSSTAQRIFITNDGADYYEPLQELFIEGYQPVATASSIILENGKIANIHGIGVAILEAPFFLAAKAINWLSGLHYRDGLNEIFQLFSAISSAFYFILGICLIHTILLNYLNVSNTKFILSLLVFGTNLFFYASGTWGLNYSHIYSFFSITLFIYLTINFYNQKGKKLLLYSILVGSIIGLNTLIRNHNCLIVIVFLLYDINSIQQAWQRLKKYIKYYIIALIFSWILFLPQMIWWHQHTDQWIINLYGKIASFNWRKPELLNLMFSIRKGLFIWTPIWIFAYLVPFVKSQLSYKWRLSFAVYLPLKLYICSSWFFWWYGGGFGQREYVDVIVLAAIGLAIFFDYLSKVDYMKIIFLKINLQYFIIILCVFIFINIIYTKGIMQGIIPFDGAETHHIIKALKTLYIFN